MQMRKGKMGSGGSNRKGEVTDVERREGKKKHCGLSEKRGKRNNEIKGAALSCCCEGKQKSWAVR